MWENLQQTAQLPDLYLRLKAASESVRARRKSVAEFRITQEDLHFFSNWLGFNSVPALEWASQNFIRPGPDASFQEMLGAVLFVAGAEAARRRATDETSILQHFASAAPHSLRLKLFDRNFEPRTSEKLPLRHAMTAALEKLSLRRVAECPGVQWWADTVKLQYGFCRESIRSQLSHWLAGRTLPVAIQHLLGMCATENKSEEFRELWLCFVHYRKGALSWHGLNEFLGKCAWVQQDAIEDYKDAGLGARIGSGTADLVDWESELVGRKELGRSQQETARPTVSVMIPETETRQGIVRRVLLEWEGDGPKLWLDLNAKDLRVPKWNTVGKHLTIQIDTGEKATWRRREDDTWEGDERIPIGSDKPPRRLAVVDSRKNILEEENLESLGLEEEVWVFGKDGVKKESSVRVIESGEELFLAAPKSADLSNFGLNCPGHQVRGARRFFQVAAGWAPSMSLAIGDEEIWTPCLSSSAGTRSQPKALVCPAEAKDFFVAGERVRLRAHLESAGEVASVNIEHSPARYIGPHWETDHEFPIDERCYPGGAPINVRVKRPNGGKRKIVTQVSIPFQGLVIDRWQSNGMVVSQILKREEELEIDGSLQVVGHVYAAPHNSGGLVLYEGAQSVDSIGQQGKTQLGRLLGWGESLSVGDAKGRRLFGLARAVINSGQVARTVPSILGSPPRLLLRTRIEPDCNEHGLHAFPTPRYERRTGRYTKGSPHLLCIRAEHDGTVWSSTTASSGDHWALAISHRKSWVGGWCDRSRCLEILGNLVRTRGCWQQLAEMFALMLWLRFPVLHSECRKRINDIVREKRDLFREVWREGKHLPEGLTYEDFDSIRGREYVCRELGVL